jgi:ribosome biogenesis protein MAK21
MGKGKNPTSKAQKPSAPATAAPAAGAGKKANVSDAFLQAIKDLGGDDSDLDLINGVDDDDEEEFVDDGKNKSKGKQDDVSSGKDIEADNRNPSRLPSASS